MEFTERQKEETMMKLEHEKNQKMYEMNLQRLEQKRASEALKY